MRQNLCFLLVIVLAVSASCIESNPQPSPLADSNDRADTYTPPEGDTSVPNDMGGNNPDEGPTEEVVGGDTAQPDTTASDTKTDSMDDVPLTGCCAVDSDCGSDELFCFTDLLGEGVCLPIPGLDQCWSDSDCLDGKLCLGALMCACEGNCPIEEHPGLCVGEGYPCCEDNAQCPSSQSCKTVTFNGGSQGSKCLGEAPETGCWSNKECGADAICADYYIKPCTEPATAQDVAGICVPLVSNCCDMDDDCTFGKICVGAVDGTQGVCLAAPDYPSCYNDSQCGGLGTCQDAVECGCGTDCTSELGYCEVYDPCCYSDLDCEAGTVCVGQNLTAGGVCVTAPVAPQCYRQGDCPLGQGCIGSQLCSCAQNCISLPGECGSIPEGCCQADTDCDEGYQCVFPFGGQQQELGGCRAIPQVGACWSDENCAEGEICIGQVVCPCGSLCETEQTGFCQSAEVQICCASDEECPLGWECAQPDKNGVCKPANQPGQCWDKGDCGLSEYCDFVQLCPCGETCGFEETPGTCNFYLPWNCCLTQQDCSDGSVCVLFKQGEVGRCLWVDEWSSGCWSDDMCPEGQTCNGEFICGCDQYCPQYETMGTCGEPPEAGCCYSAMDCGPNEVCTGKADVPGTCAPAPAFGDCWSNADCYWTQGCLDAVIPMCGELVVPEVGKCSPMPSNCCWKNQDCPEGRVCRNQGYYATDLPGFCVWDPKGPACGEGQNCCWNDSDCPPESWCSGANSCACLELCSGCGTCNNLKAGTCIPWGGPWD